MCPTLENHFNPIPERVKPLVLRISEKELTGFFNFCLPTKKTWWDYKPLDSHLNTNDTSLKLDVTNMSFLSNNQHEIYQKTNTKYIKKQKL